MTDTQAKKVLIAEDDKFLANAYRVKLTKEGFDIKIAVNGVETIKMLLDFKPDLIVLDLVMPIKDGFTVLEELKASEEWKSIPVLIASNLGQKEDVDRGMSLGADGYIIKSDLSMSQMVSKINALIEKK